MKTTKEERKKQRRIEKFKNICKMEQTDLKVKMQNGNRSTMTMTLCGVRSTWIGSTEKLKIFPK